MRIAIVLALLSSTAAADVGDEGPKDPEVATWLSVGATAASYTALTLPLVLDATDTTAGELSLGAGLAGVLLAPSLGRAYAEQYTASGALVVRIVAIPTAALGLLVRYAECENERACNPATAPWGTGVVIGAGAMFVGATVWELFTVGDAARTYNRRWRDPPPLSIVPTGSGLAIAGSW